MRKLYYMLFIAALLCSCSKERPEPEVDGGTEDAGQEEVRTKVPQILNPTFEEILTRTFLDTDMKMTWHPDDALSYFTDTYSNVRYAIDDRTGESPGRFSRKSDGNHESVSFDRNYAIYPYDETTVLSYDGVASYTFPPLQKYAEGTFAENVNVMFAATKGREDHSLRFRNCCGYLRLQLYGTDVTLRSVVLSGNASEPLAGKAEISVGGSGTPEVLIYDASSSLMLDCGDGVTLGRSVSSPTSFWLVIPPVLFSQGLTLTLTDDGGREFIKSYSAPLSVERNVVLTLDAFEAFAAVSGSTMSFSDIEGSWTLVKWHGTSPPFSVNMEIGADGSVVLWQKIDDYEWERYDSMAALDSNVISGTYSDNLPWSASYCIEFDGDDMVWTNTQDESDVSVYVKTSLE